jgi:hypothetical protein
MDEKLMRAISEFVTRRINDLGADAPAAVTDAVSEAEEQKERLAAALSEKQRPLLRAFENALGVQSGEETRYYYRAGFYDAVKFLLEWSGAD